MLGLRKFDLGEKVMSKVILTIFFLLCISNYAFPQEVESFDLRWKLQDGEKITYKSSLQKIDTLETKEYKIDIGGFFGFLPDSIIDKSKDFFERFNSLYDDAELYSILEKDKNNNISISIVAENVVLPQIESDSLQDFNKFLSNFNQGVILRGSVTEDGEIASFYLKQEQRNLIALMFELPSHPVQVGDSWKLDVSLLMFDQNFVCDSSARKNSVTFAQVKNINADTIALLNYDIYEFAKGIFNTPFSKDGVPTSMEMSYRGIAEFSISKGRWLSYNGLSKMKASGVMNTSFIQRDYLAPVDDLPETIKSKLNK